MKILLIGTQSTTDDNEDYYEQYLSFFKHAISYSEQPHEILNTLLDDLVIIVGDGAFSITDKRNELPLEKYDLVLIRGHVREHFDVVKTLSMYLKLHGVTVVNDYSSFRSSSKLTQAVQFHEIGLPVAKTVLVTPAVVRNPHAIPFAFPCIMKATYGSHGDHNFLIHNHEELVRILNENEKREFVLQRFVPNDEDFRILIVGAELLVIKRKAVSGSHLNNTSQGGKAELVPASTLPRALIDQAKQIIEHLGMTIAGVDVLFDKETGEHSFLEVNSQPQLMTGAFTDEKAKLVGGYLRKYNSKHEV